MYLNGTKCCSLILGCVFSLSAVAKEATPTVGQALPKPLSFIENRGQITGENNMPANDIQFKLSTPGMNLYVGNGQLHYQFNKTEAASATAFNSSAYRMDVTLLGANTNAKVIQSDPQEYFENYYTSQSATDGITAHSWNKITYKNVYPNIDWVLYVKNNKVEYDFVVRPGGKVADIKLQYGGATALKLTKDGSISAETPMGGVSEKTPYAYETKTGRAVASNFVVRDNIVSFETGSYDGAITIDPYLLWSTYFGSTNEDVATSVRQLTGGSTFVGGYTASTTLISTAGVYQTAYGGGAYDAFVTRYTTTGTRTFTTYFGAGGSDKGNCIAIDNAGALYLAGSTTSAPPAPPALAALATTGAYHTVNNGGSDGFIIKLNNATGARTWCTFYGGTGDDQINGITCDVSGNVYVTGQTASATLISTAGAYQTAMSGVNDAFVAKFNTSGAIQWSTYYGGSALEEGLGIATDATNNVVITGQTNSVVGIATAGSYQQILDGTNDAFVAKFSTLGVLGWGTYFGGSGTEQGNGVVCDAISGSIAVVGNTTSTDNIASFKAYQPAYGGGVQDAFVGYLSSGGSVIWSTYYGGASLDYGQSICLDPYRNIIIGGGTFSATGIASAGSFQPAIGGDYDAYMAKMNRLGQRMWGTYFGNTLYEYAFGVSCDAANQPVLVGHTTSTAGIATTGVDRTVYGGGTYDGFVTKFKADTVVAITQPFIDTVLCATGTFNLNFTANTNFAPGNSYTAQLSDASGSFAAPVTIGTLTSNATTGNIPCTIPAGTAAGTGYRIRIVASTPGFVSPDDFYDIQIFTTSLPTTATSNSPVCVGGTLNLFDAGAYTVSSYSWTGPASFTSALQNPTITGVTLANGGTYTVVTTHNGCLSDAQTVTVTVNSFIPPTPTASSSNPNCLGSSILLYSNSTLGTTPVTYHWSGPAAFTSTLQNPTVPTATFANSGWYYVNDTLDGCPSLKDSVQITVNAVTPVTINITASPNDTVCFGTLVTFNATITNGGISPTYQWMSGTSPIVGAISSTWSSSSLLDGETIWCQLHSSITCPSPINAPSNSIVMNVINNPPIAHISSSIGPVIAPGATVTFTSVTWNAGTAPTYQWLVNGTIIAGATNATYIRTAITHNDTVSMILYSNMGCATPAFATSNAIVIHPAGVGVINVNATTGNISLFPNPNPGSFTISGSIEGSDISKLAYEVINPLGQVINTGSIAVNNHELNAPVELNGLANGIYLIHLSGEGYNKTLRCSIQH